MPCCVFWLLIERLLCLTGGFPSHDGVVVALNRTETSGIQRMLFVAAFERRLACAAFNCGPSAVCSMQYATPAKNLILSARLNLLLEAGCDLH